VFAAASLKNALDEALLAFNENMRTPAAVSYAGSSALARQIEKGAPADLFVSADIAWMDWLQERDLIQTGSRTDLLGNRLVLAGAQGAAPMEIARGFDLKGALLGGRLAMALVDAVPAGRYGKQALEHLGVWDSVKDSLAQTDNVRAALLLVSRGEAPLGIVYATDAASDPKVGVVGTFPEDSHKPIRYPVALTRGAKPEALALLDHLQSEEAARIFRRHGFEVLK
jgi:molybdate transport system substrate-binding protein